MGSSRWTVKNIFEIFVLWRLFLLLIALVVPVFFELQDNFIGGGRQLYIQNPLFWGHVNFDGEHYLAIAQRSYRDLEYFYFPGYPLLVKSITQLISSSVTVYAVVGLLISHLSFFLTLVGFYKLVKLDFKENVAKWSLIALLVFPTSFYFASFYTESIFLMLVIWSFYFARKKMYLFSGLLGAFASATRLVGVVLLPALFWDKTKLFKKVSLVVVPTGLIIYILYLNKVTGDPLEFLHSVEIFGSQRSSTLILLPQVFYRYIFKLLPSLDYSYFPVILTTFLEFSVASVFSALTVLTFFRLRPSYAIYTTLAFLIPTFSGSFSSLPRYVLVLFPAFILFGRWLSTCRKFSRIVFIAGSALLLTVAFGLFFRGFWIS